jgi:hypothetical protein
MPSPLPRSTRSLDARRTGALGCRSGLLDLRTRGLRARERRRSGASELRVGANVTESPGHANGAPNAAALTTTTTMVKPKYKHQPYHRRRETVRQTSTATTKPSPTAPQSYTAPCYTLQFYYNIAARAKLNGDKQKKQTPHAREVEISGKYWHRL